MPERAGEFLIRYRRNWRGRWIAETIYPERGEIIFRSRSYGTRQTVIEIVERHFPNAFVIDD